MFTSNVATTTIITHLYDFGQIIMILIKGIEILSPEIYPTCIWGLTFISLCRLCLRTIMRGPAFTSFLVDSFICILNMYTFAGACATLSNELN